MDDVETSRADSGGACDVNPEEWRHAHIFRSLNMGRTLATIETLKTNRNTRVLVRDEAQRDYMIERGVLPGQIVTFPDLFEPLP